MSTYRTPSSRATRFTSPAKSSQEKLEPREVTEISRKHESSVMMSSVMPSLR